MAQLTTLAELTAKMGEYTGMEEEIPFAEFISYSNALFTFLQQEWQTLTEEDMVPVKGITQVLSNNAKMRALRKDANAKKYLKIDEKAKLWEQAAALRLTKSGMTQEVLAEKVAALWP